jgi:hypothetical protein
MGVAPTLNMLAHSMEAGHIHGMNNAVAIIFAGCSIAAAILFVNRWDMTPVVGGVPMLVKTNRWTGSSEVCVIDRNLLQSTDPKALRLLCP